MLMKLSLNGKVISSIQSAASTSVFKIAAFALLTAIAAQVSIPVEPVPFTLQTMLVLLSGAFLGWRNGALSQLLYISLGASGLPVFANGFAGAAVLFGPTGGYLLAFPAAALVTGFVVEKTRNYLLISVSMFAAEALVLISGMVYLNVMYILNWNEAIAVGGTIFSVWSVVKVFIAVTTYFGIKKVSK